MPITKCKTILLKNWHFGAMGFNLKCGKRNTAHCLKTNPILCTILGFDLTCNLEVYIQYGNNGRQAFNNISPLGVLLDAKIHCTISYIHLYSFYCICTCIMHMCTNIDLHLLASVWNYFCADAAWAAEVHPAHQPVSRLHQQWRRMSQWLTTVFIILSVYLQPQCFV